MTDMDELRTELGDLQIQKITVDAAILTLEQKAAEIEVRMAELHDEVMNLIEEEERDESG